MEKPLITLTDIGIILFVTFLILLLPATVTAYLMTERVDDPRMRRKMIWRGMLTGFGMSFMFFLFLSLTDFLPTVGREPILLLVLIGSSAGGAWYRVRRMERG